MNFDYEIRRLKKEASDTRKRLIELEMDKRDLAQRLALAGKILEGIQPILGRLIATSVVLEKKGILNEHDLAAITETQADYFVASAGEKPPEEVRDQSNGAGTVASDSGNGGTGVSGTPSDGGSAESNPKPKDGDGPVVTRLQALRAAHDSSNRVVNISSAKKKDVPT